MLIWKLYMPFASPGLAAIGYGLVGAISGVYTIAELVLIVLGLLVVVIAGMFTIRSNVAKIWREQAEAEKARNLDLVAQVALERGLKEKALEDLRVAQARTDVSTVLKRLDEILMAVQA